MASTFNVTLIGLDKLLGDIKKYSEDIQTEIDAEIEDTARKVQMKAVEDAQAKIAPLAHEGMNALGQSVSKGGANSIPFGSKQPVMNLPSMIGYEKKGKFSHEIESRHPLSAYFEFGTGVTVFQGETWIDEELRQYARTFYVNGKGTITPHPFLFNNFYEERIKLVEKLKKITGA